MLLALLLEQETELEPMEFMTDTAAYSDAVFGLFLAAGLPRPSPRLADLGDARLWRIDRKADYGPFNSLSKGTINLALIRENWPDVIRLAGSLKLGHLKAAVIMRTLQVRDKPTSLARALSEIGRIAKTIHILHYIDDLQFRVVEVGVQNATARNCRIVVSADVFTMVNAGRLEARFSRGRKNLAYPSISAEAEAIVVATQSVGDLPVGSVQMEIPGQLIRRRLEKPIEQLRKGDILVVTRLDRLARSTSELLRIAERLTEKKAPIAISCLGRLRLAPEIFSSNSFSHPAAERRWHWPSRV